MDHHHRRLWLACIVFCSCLGCVLPQTRDDCPAGFVTAPPAVVVVPEGGGLSVMCAHSDIDLNFYREGTLIPANEPPEEDCDCTIESGGSLITGRTLNLTFINFEAESIGTFGCWRATGPAMFDECNFEVVLAELPSVTLNQNNVAGAMVGSTMTITPTITLGIPEATVTWKHYNRVLSPDTDSRVTLLANGGLRVANIRAGDRGTYTITASNTASIAAETVISASVNVTINFLDPVDPTSDLVGSNYMLTCRVSGFPPPVVIWSTSTRDNIPSSMMSNTGGFETNITSILTLPQSECTDVNQVYTCEATSGSTTVSDGVTPCDAPLPPEGVILEVLTPTSVRVSWMESPLPTVGYRIQYREEGGNLMVTEFIPRGETTFTVMGLSPGSTVEFEVGSVTTEAEGASPSYSEEESVMLPECDVAPELEIRVTDVNAELVSQERQRTIRISWNLSTEQGVTGYMLTIRPSPDPTSDSTSSDMKIIQRTEYMLPADACNGRMYSFTVVPLNQCNSPGPEQTVSQSCSAEHGNPVGVTVSSRSTQALSLDVTAQNLDIDLLRISATTIVPTQEGNLRTYNYVVRDYAPGESVCIGGLEVGTFYNVCVTTQLNNGVDGGTDCTEESTRREDEGTNNLGECLEHDSITDNGAPIMDATDFPDWAIAVIVVGVLAVVAIIFCFIGLCFACNTSNSKDYDVGSVSSLQTASIPPGPGVPPYLPNYRNNSPQRSCLSYNKNGHRLNWNEHRDTLRQMDTDSGTHV